MHQKQIDFVYKLKEAYEHALHQLPKTTSPIPFDWIWPQAALESNWGGSGVAQGCNNLFGIKGTHFGEGPCTSHHPPKNEGPEPYTQFKDWADCLVGYMRKITTQGNWFHPCFLSGMTYGKHQYWHCLQEYEWAGKNHVYAKAIESVAASIPPEKIAEIIRTYK